MKLLILLFALSWVWVSYEMYVAPYKKNDEQLKNYESDDEAIF